MRERERESERLAGGAGRRPQASAGLISPAATGRKGLFTCRAMSARCMVAGLSSAWIGADNGQSARMRLRGGFGMAAAPQNGEWRMERRTQALCRGDRAASCYVGGCGSGLGDLVDFDIVDLIDPDNVCVPTK